MRISDWSSDVCSSDLEGQAPGGCVEHRHDRKGDGAGGQVENVRTDLDQGVEHRRSMLIENALWIAGRAAGVAEHRRLALVAFDPGIIVAFGGDQILELAIIETDIMLDRLRSEEHTSEERGKEDGRRTGR